MRVMVKKWGNSAAVRIPASVMQAAKISLDSPVTVREQNGCILIEPDLEPGLDLNTLLDGIRPDNIHEEFYTGTPVGREIL